MQTQLPQDVLLLVLEHLHPLDVLRALCVAEGWAAAVREACARWSSVDLSPAAADASASDAALRALLPRCGPGLYELRLGAGAAAARWDQALREWASHPSLARLVLLGSAFRPALVPAAADALLRGRGCDDGVVGGRHLFALLRTFQLSERLSLGGTPVAARCWDVLRAVIDERHPLLDDPGVHLDHLVVCTLYATSKELRFFVHFRNIMEVYAGVMAADDDVQAAKRRMRCMTWTPIAREAAERPRDMSSSIVTFYNTEFVKTLGPKVRRATMPAIAAPGEASVALPDASPNAFRFAQNGGASWSLGGQ